MKRALTRALLMVVAVFAIGAAATVVPEALDNRPECVKAEEWVASNADVLPSTLEELEEYPLTYRTRAFSKLSPDAKASIWRAQMSRALDRPDLSADQKALIREMLPKITANLYAMKLKGPKELEARARHLFVTHEHRDLMIQLGGHTVRPRAMNFSAVRLKLASVLRNWTSASAQNLGSCDCPKDGECWNHCGADTSCRSPGDTRQYCTVSPDGCGFLGGCPCDGLCCSDDGGVCIPGPIDG